MNAPICILRFKEIMILNEEVRFVNRNVLINSFYLMPQTIAAPSVSVHFQGSMCMFYFFIDKPSGIADERVSRRKQS